MSYSHAGFEDTGIAAVTTLAITTHGVGNLRVFCSAQNAGAITAVSSSRVRGLDGGSGWTKIYPNQTSTWSTSTQDIWAGVVTSVGADTINVTYPAGATNTSFESDEFADSNVNVLWLLDVLLNVVDNGTASTAINYPSGTPTGSKTDIYYGAGFIGASSTGVTGLTSGFVDESGSHSGREVLYALAVNGTVSPSFTYALAGKTTSIAVLMASVPLLAPAITRRPRVPRVPRALAGLVRALRPSVTLPPPAARRVRVPVIPRRFDGPVWAPPIPATTPAPATPAVLTRRPARALRWSRTAGVTLPPTGLAVAPPALPPAQLVRRPVRVPRVPHTTAGALWPVQIPPPVIPYAPARTTRQPLRCPRVPRAFAGAMPPPPGQPPAAPVFVPRRLPRALRVPCRTAGIIRPAGPLVPAIAPPTPARTARQPLRAPRVPRAFAGATTAPLGASVPPPPLVVPVPVLTRRPFRVPRVPLRTAGARMAVTGGVAPPPPTGGAIVMNAQPTPTQRRRKRAQYVNMARKGGI